MILNQTLATIITSLGYMSYLSILPNLLLIHFAQFNYNTPDQLSNMRVVYFSKLLNLFY